MVRTTAMKTARRRSHGLRRWRYDNRVVKEHELRRNPTGRHRAGDEAKGRSRLEFWTSTAGLGATLWR